MASDLHFYILSIIDYSLVSIYQCDKLNIVQVGKLDLSSRERSIHRDALFFAAFSTLRSPFPEYLLDYNQVHYTYFHQFHTTSRYAFHVSTRRDARYLIILVHSIHLHKIGHANPLIKFHFLTKNVTPFHTTLGGQHESKIQAIVVSKDFTYTAAGSNLYKWYRGKLISKREDAHLADITHLHLIGDHLISASTREPKLHIWLAQSLKWFDSFEIDNPHYLHISTLIHPHTYMNKILIGTQEGPLQLWNLKNKKLIHSFDGWDSGVSCIAQSPVVDVVAIGLLDGRIIIHNLRLDKTLFQLNQSEGLVSTLTFRTDTGFNHLVSGTRSGTLVIWDLDKRSLCAMIRHAHDNVITHAQFFVNEPLMITSGMDNAIKVWIFDQPNSSARILRHRSGHHLPPTRIKFFNTSSTILSGSNDRSFRFFSTIRDQRSRELSQGHLESHARKHHYVQSTDDLKLPPIVNFHASIRRQKQWDNIITCHRNMKSAISWNKENCVMGKHQFKSTESPASPITAVCISSCGNFVVIASLTGFIDKYNMESGQHRGTFPSKKSFSTLNFNEIRHTHEVTGLSVDILNRFLISASIDRHLKFWNFADGTLHSAIDLGSPITMMELCPESSLLAVATDDFTIHIYDIDTQICVRRLSHDYANISDMSFTGDARWLVSAYGDSTIRVWDLPTGQCINWLRTKSPIISLSLSPRGDFLATTHTNSRGIYLWANKNYFSNMFLRPVTSSQPSDIEMPKIESTYDAAYEEAEDDRAHERFEDLVLANAQKDDYHPPGKQIIDNVSISKDGGEEDESCSEDEMTSADHSSKDMDLEEDMDSEDDEILNQELITYSNISFNKWHTLVHLDMITERNKPKETPQPPKSAPFLLPTLPGINPKFIIDEEQNHPSSNNRFDLSMLNSASPFIILLKKIANQHGGLSTLANQFSPENQLSYLSQPSPFTEAVKDLIKMTPNAIDFEIRALRIEQQYMDFKLILILILDQLARQVNYDMAQAILNVLLKNQSSVLAEAIHTDSEMKKLVTICQELHRTRWTGLQELLHHNLCLITLFSKLHL